MVDLGATSKAIMLLQAAYLFLILGMAITYILVRLLYRQDSLKWNIALVLSILTSAPSVYLLVRAVKTHLGLEEVFLVPPYYLLFAAGYYVAIYAGLKKLIVANPARRRSLATTATFLAFIGLLCVWL